MAINDIFRNTMTFSMPDNTIAQWVWYMQQTAGAGVLTAPLAAAVITNVAAAYEDIKSIVSTAVTALTLDIAQWDPTLKEFNGIRTATVAGIAGTNGSEDMLPHQEAGVVKFYTSKPRSLGKKFIMGLVETACVASVFTAPNITKMALFAANFDAPVIQSANTFVPGNFNLATETFLAWNGTVEANALTGSMDSRRPGIGI